MSNDEQSLDTARFETQGHAEQAATLLRTFAPHAEITVAERLDVPFVVRIVSDYADGWFGTWEHIARFVVSFCAPAARGGALASLPEVMD